MLHIFTVPECGIAICKKQSAVTAYAKQKKKYVQQPALAVITSI
jgi:hypothetical protein